MEKQKQSQIMAILSMIMSVLGILTICIAIGGVFNLVGLILGVLVLIKKKPGRTLAIISIVVSLVSLILFSIIILLIPGDKEFNTSQSVQAIETVESNSKAQMVSGATTNAVDATIATETTIQEETSDQETVYYMDLYNNYEDYLDHRVIFSGQVSYVGKDNINIKGQITGVTGMIYIQPTDKSACESISVDDYIIVTGNVDKRVAGYLYIKDADIVSGEEAKSFFNSQIPEPSTLSPEQSAQEKESEEEYKASCQEISYKSLLRTPDDYIGQHIVITAKIQQIMSGGWFDDSKYYRVQTDNESRDWYMDDEYYMYDGRPDGSIKILKDDVIKIYAEFIGLEEIHRALTGTTDEVPAIRAYYVELISE